MVIHLFHLLFEFFLRNLFILSASKFYLIENREKLFLKCYQKLNILKKVNMNVLY